MALVLALALMGVLTGAWLAASVILFGGYIAWHAYQSYQFERWLLGANGKTASRLKGIWAYAAQRVQTLKQREQAGQTQVAQLSQQLHRTLEAMPDAAVVLEADMSVRWYNSAAQRLLGLPAAYTGSTVRPDWLANNDELRQYLMGGDFAHPLELHSPVSAARSLSLSAVAFGQGQYLLTAHDVSEHKRIQEVRRDFIADVSHELRTPLTVITGYLEMLAEESLAEPVHNAILASERQAERMQRIVVDLLMLSRLEMGEDVEQQPKQPVAVTELLQGLVEDARRLSGERKHRVELHADANLRLLGDENQLLSAFGNLIFNAVLHTPVGTAIDVFWQKQGEEAVLTVADQGPGIAEQHLARLTERFYRVDKGRSRERGGTGLGLSIVKHVLLRHEARIDILSKPGEGARFICHFPKSRVLQKLGGGASSGIQAKTE